MYFLSSHLRKKNFGISYMGRDKQGQEAYLSLMSDWDLGMAFATASKPYLQLKVDIKPSEDSEWSIYLYLDQENWVTRVPAFALPLPIPDNSQVLTYISGEAAKEVSSHLFT